MPFQVRELPVHPPVYRTAILPTHSPIHPTTSATPTLIHLHIHPPIHPSLQCLHMPGPMLCFSSRPVLFGSHPPRPPGYSPEILRGMLRFASMVPFPISLAHHDQPEFVEWTKLHLPAPWPWAMLRGGQSSVQRSPPVKDRFRGSSLGPKTFTSAKKKNPFRGGFSGPGARSAKPTSSCAPNSARRSSP